MESQQPDSSKLVKRYTRLAIVCAFLLAMLWSLGSFFIWIFLCPAVYFAFLAYFYSPRTSYSEPRFQYTRSRGESYGTTSSVNISPKNLKLAVAIFIISVVFFFIILMIIGFANSDETSKEMQDIALTENREALQADPNNIDALTNLGNSFYASGQYDSAIAYYDKVLDIDSKNSSGLFNKGLAYYAKQDYANSMNYLKQCITLYPDNVDALIVLGDNYYSQNQYTQAMSWYKQAYEKGARTAGMLNIMAFIYDQQNQKSEAIRLYKETLQQDSGLVDVYNRLAELEPNNADLYKKKAEAWK